MALTLYRRHTTACIKHYDQNRRIFPPRTAKELKADCECPIVAAGSLRLEAKRIKHVSTETNRWDKALATARLWEEWEALTDPNPTPQDQNVTFDEAAARWLALKGPQGENIGSAAFAKYPVMLSQRIKPFCIERNIQFIQAFENPTVVTDCFLSFRNLNPHRNRKNQPAVVKPLGDTSKRAELERYRAFLRFSVDQGWLKHNHALKIKLGKLAPSAKFGLLPQEETQVWDAIDRVKNRRQTGQYNAKELRALCLVMRYAGFRRSLQVQLGLQRA